MKKVALFFVVAACMMFSQTANSQIRFGIRGGLNLSSPSLDGVNYTDKSSYNGFNVGPTLEAMFGPIGVEGSLLYSKKGISFDLLGTSHDISVNYLEIPLNLKLKFGLPGLKIYGVAGPYFSYGFKGNVSNLVSVDFSKWDVGGNVGAGVELLKFIQVGVGYSFGFSDNTLSIAGITAGNYKNGVFSVNAGLYF